MAQAGIGADEPVALVDDANTERLFFNLELPQWGHLVPFHSLERTRISLSRSQPSQ
jgi:hypothetical protein